MADFAAQMRVFALDTVGQPGCSAPHPPGLLGGEYALWLTDVPDGLDLERAAMPGISSGAWTVIELGRHAPRRLHKAVLLSPMRLARAKLNGRRWVGNAMKPVAEDDVLEDRLTVRDFSPSSDGRQYDQHLARQRRCLRATTI